ncbi:protein kinase [bacterium]|nr:protein kinase [bacterium]
MWPFAELKALAGQAGKVEFQAGEMLFRQGDAGDKVFLIRRGLVEIFAENSGRRRRLNLRGRGEVIGEMALLDGLGRSASAVARTQLQARTLSRDVFEQLLTHRPALVRSLTSHLSHRMRELQGTLSSELDKRDQEGKATGLFSIGPFLLAEKLGEGGMGVIYSASHQRTGHPYAVKVLSVSSEEQRARFTRECEFMARMVHPNIVRIDSAGTEGYYGYMAMELLRGETLEQRLKRGPLSEVEVSRWFVPAMEALGYAHDMGVMHRDVKPANLFLTLDGTLKMLDFGIARRINGPELTVAGRFFGTPQYLAPERIGGQSKAQERQSDQYSLGISMYEAATGRCPFDFDDVAEVLAAHLHRCPTLPSTIAAVDHEVELVIMRLLAKEPSRRYPSFAAAAQALAAATSGSVKSMTTDFGTRRD